MPSALKRTGSAAVRARVPDAVSGATKQLATRRDRPAIASTTAAAAEASAYGPGGHNAAMRAASLRRDGSSIWRLSAKPPIVASSHGITV